jgi:hypothetical protein
MRLLTFIFLFSSTLLSFSQKGMRKEKFPFQVLFAEDAFINGKEVEQFQYLSENSVLDVMGQITLFHHSGKMFELEAGSYRVKHFVVYESGKHYSRPVLEPNGKYRKPKSPRTAGVTDRFFQEIEIIVPNNIDNRTKWTEPVKLVWILKDYDDYLKPQTFEITFSNIYDEMLRVVETPNFYLEFLPDTLDINKNRKPQISEGLLIISIKKKGAESYSSSEFGIKLIDQGEDTGTTRKDSNYFILRVALYYDYIKKNLWADAYYQNAIIMSKEDTRIVKLYEDFLERNPQFK